MIIVDGHCDTLSKIHDSNENLMSNQCHADISRMKKAGKYVQLFSVFVDSKQGPLNNVKKAMSIISYALRQFEKYNEEIMLCLNYNDIITAIGKNKIAAVMIIEGGDVLNGRISTLNIMYRLGIRGMGLTWNYNNDLAHAAMDSSEEKGLTPFGIEVVQYMNDKKMIIDVSHLSEHDFWDLMSKTDRPFIASHSNCRSICDVPRNLTDKQIIALAKRGGVIGVNFYPYFLNSKGKASIDDIIRHIEHICGLAGEEAAGIGSDFDGIDTTPYDLKGVEDIEKLYNKLAQLNYKQSLIEKIAGMNFLNALKKILA